MTVELNNDMRHALGLAVQILEDMPERLRPLSDMNDMRDLLAGKSTGRDGAILTEAIAIVLAWRSFDIIEGGARDAELFGKRFEEFSTLFALVQRADTRLLALHYVEICDRLARSRIKEADQDGEAQS